MTDKSVFVDTGAWFATIDYTDQNYESASRYIKDLHEQQTRLITSDLVINETVMLLARKISKEAAIAFVKAIHRDQSVQVIYVDKQTQHDAYALFEKYADQDFSIVDCASFVIMKNHKIKRAFSFDRHFGIMHFSCEPW